MATTTTDDSTTKTSKKEEKKRKNKHDKKEKKDRKSKERRRNDDEAGDGPDFTDPPNDNNDVMTSRGKRRKVTQEVADDGADVKANPGKSAGRKFGDSAAGRPAAGGNIAAAVAPDSAKDDSPDATASRQSSKRERRKQLVAQLPSRDEDGIAYTKLQLRRMRKRVERGLDPIETPREAADRARREAEMRREEQAEWAGLLHQGNQEDEKDQSENGDGKGDEDGEEEDQEESDKESNSSPSSKMVSGSDSAPAATSHRAPQGDGGVAAKKRRDKPVPPDYVCLACQNRHQPRHWIYDCAEKVTMRGTNQVSKKHGKGAQNPKNKVFVSGLPFDATTKSVTDWFAHKCGAVATVKVLTFDDSKRCRGQAFVAFESAEAVRAALSLTGTVMKGEGKAKDADASKNGKQLKLKVTKALHRAATKSTTKAEKAES
jgi:RNA recognition motif. (a.k.a. RRM, RBD, or RNP domain)